MLFTGPRFTAVNSNLSLWEASLGSSYMCKKEQSFNITDTLILNTFELQVQPFGLSNNAFSTGKLPIYQTLLRTLKSLSNSCECIDIPF